MIKDSVLFCQVDATTLMGQEQQRLLCLEESGLLSHRPPAILTELLETTVKLLDFPIAWIGLMDRDYLRLQGSYGLSKFGLTHALTTQRAIPRLETFCTHVVDSQQGLAIPDTFAHTAFAKTTLAQTYGIRAYLGAPLIWVNEDQACFCVGTIAVLDVRPRQLLPSDRQWLEILARWCMSEYTLAMQSRKESSSSIQTLIPSRDLVRGIPDPDQEIRLQTIHNLVQECHNPITAIMGMARMLDQEIYGSLTPKQREYIEVIHHSSQTLLLQIQEIQSLSTLPAPQTSDCILPTDLALISQNLIQQLAPIAQENNIDLDFSSEHSSNLWYGDADQIRQMLSHLFQGVIGLTGEPGTLHLHLSSPPQAVKFTLWFLTLWVDNPHPEIGGTETPSRPDRSAEIFPPRLKFCKQLVEQLQGSFEIESSPDMGKRYTIILPVTNGG